MRARWVLVPVALVAACGSDDAVDVGATASQESTCERITAFAEAVTDVGITYDYEPSTSPAGLASRTDAVLVGALTGGFAHRDAEPDEPVTSWIGFEIEVTDVVQGDVQPGERAMVAIPYNPAAWPADRYEDAIVPGAEVVVFAEEVADPPAELFVGVEGFATACDGGGAPQGRIGQTTPWAEATTLDALLEAAAAPPDQVEVGLWHCGIDVLHVEGRTWEVPDGEEPFDGTNAPESFVGRGTIERVGPDELRYVDESGVELRFAPDDGTEAPCA